MFKNILLVPSSDEPTQPGVKRVTELAARSASVEVFKPVHDTLLDGYMGRADLYERLRNRLVEEHSERIAAIARQLASHGLESFAKAQWSRAYDQAIAHEVMAQRIDLVVTEPLRGDVGGWTQQDWRMLSLCPAPVLVVKSDGTDPYQRLVAAVEPLHKHAKPAELDAAILALAGSLQSALRGTLRVVHCFSPLTNLAIDAAESLPLDDAERALEEAHRNRLRELVTQAGLPAESAEILAGKPSEVLGALYERGEADLVVMGALSRGRIKDFLIGSTAERLLRRVDGDVLLVKPPGFEVALKLGA